jgi:hypothetical protein
MLGKIVDGIAAVPQLTGLAVDIGTGGPIEVDTLEAALNLDRLGCFGH